MVTTHDDLRPLYRVMLAVGVAAFLILCVGFALLLRFAPPGERTGYRAHVTGVFDYDPSTGMASGPAKVRFHRDEPFAARVDWNRLPPTLTVGARWTDSLDDDVGTISPSPAGDLSEKGTLVPVRTPPQFHTNLPGQYTLTVVRYANGQPVELLATARVAVVRDR